MTTTDRISSRHAHDLKTDAQAFADVLAGRKTHEIRLDDRGYRVGETLRLHETVHTGAEMAAGAPLVYTGRQVRRLISHVQRGYGLAPGWVILSFVHRPNSARGTPSTAGGVAMDPERARAAAAAAIARQVEGEGGALVCQACAGDAPGGKCQTRGCAGGPIVREIMGDGTGQALPPASDQVRQAPAAFACQDPQRQREIAGRTP